MALAGPVAVPASANRTTAIMRGIAATTTDTWTTHETAYGSSLFAQDRVLTLRGDSLAFPRPPSPMPYERIEAFSLPARNSSTDPNPRIRAIASSTNFCDGRSHPKFAADPIFSIIALAGALRPIPHSRRRSPWLSVAGNRLVGNATTSRPAQPLRPISGRRAMQARPCIRAPMRHARPAPSLANLCLRLPGSLGVGGARSSLIVVNRRYRDRAVSWKTHRSR
jgi:hypothetical protein